jgi:acyl-CoA synthetase
MLRHPAVDKVAVIPVPDERLGEKVCLAILLKGHTSLEDDAVLAHLEAAGLSRFDMPEYLARLDRMPIGPSGKIMKRDLVDAVGRGELAMVSVRFVPESRRGSSVGADAAGEK